MLRPLIVCIVIVLGIGVPARAQDGIPPDTLNALKRATVFVQTSGATGKASGSGFVVAVQKDTVLIATNHHVVATADHDRKARLNATELIRSGVAIDVVARLLTHRSSTTTSQIYIHLDVADVRAALHRAGVWDQEPKAR